jgi:hypothetical protein
MSSLPPPSKQDQVEYDPVFLHSRREAVVIFFVWLVTMLWAVPFCYINGYVTNFDPQQFSTIWGIPMWLFFGIFVPWIVADVATTWFCFGYMVDDDLGQTHEGADIEEEIAEMHSADKEAEA